MCIPLFVACFKSRVGWSETTLPKRHPRNFWGSVCPTCALRATFIMTVPDSVLTITQRSLGLGNVTTVVLGSDCERGFHQQGGPKEFPEGRQLDINCGN